MNNTISGNSVQPLIYEPRPASASGGGQPRGAFEDVLHNALGQVEKLQADSDQGVSALLEGDRGDIHNVMIAIEKADVAFQLMMQVRNKIVNAYQQVSQMQF